MEKIPKKSIKERVEEALNEIRPYLRTEGGGIDLIDISQDGKIIKVKLTGACSFCPHSFYTLKMGVEQSVKEKVPEVESVEAI